MPQLRNSCWQLVELLMALEKANDKVLYLQFSSLIPSKKYADLRNQFPDNLRRELLKKWLRYSDFSL